MNGRGDADAAGSVGGEIAPCESACVLQRLDCSGGRACFFAADPPAAFPVLSPPRELNVACATAFFSRPRRARLGTLGRVDRERARRLRLRTAPSHHGS